MRATTGKGDAGCARINGGGWQFRGFPCGGIFIIDFKQEIYHGNESC